MAMQGAAKAQDGDCADKVGRIRCNCCGGERAQCRRLWRVLWCACLQEFLQCLFTSYCDSVALLPMLWEPYIPLCNCGGVWQSPRLKDGTEAVTMFTELLLCVRDILGHLCHRSQSVHTFQVCT